MAMSVQFESKGKIGTDQPAQTVAVLPPRKNGKATNSAPDQTKPKKQVYQEKQIFQKPKKLVWATKNKYAYQPKTYAPRQSLTSCFVLRNNSSGKLVAKYIRKETNIYRNTSIWVPKILVTNIQGPKSNWGPKSSN